MRARHDPSNPQHPGRPGQPYPKGGNAKRCSEAQVVHSKHTRLRASEDIPPATASLSEGGGRRPEGVPTVCTRLLPLPLGRGAPVRTLGRRGSALSVTAANGGDSFAHLAAFTVSVQAFKPARKAVRLRRFRAAFLCHWQRWPAIPHRGSQAQPVTLCKIKK